MSDNQKKNENESWNNIGDQIKNVVQDALESGDFKQLNDMVAGTVTSALDEAKRQVKAATGQFKDVGRDVADEFKKKGGFDNRQQSASSKTQDWNTSGNSPTGWNQGGFNGQGKPGGQGGNQGQGSFSTGAGSQGWNPGAWGNKFSQQARGWYGTDKGPWTPRQVRDTFHYNRSKSRSRSRSQFDSANAKNQINQNSQIYQSSQPDQEGKQKHYPMVRFNRVGHVSGILHIVFGGIGTGLATVGLGVVGILMLVGTINVLWPLAIPAGILLFFLNMIQRGLIKKDRVKRAERYLQVCAGKMYMNLEDLASHLGNKKKTIRKDIRKMLKLGMFPEGHLDAEGDCLMLDDKTYSQYLDIQREKSLLEKELNQTRKVEAEPVQQAEAPREEAAVNQELEDMINQGKEFIRKLRDRNDAIESDIISSKLFQLENLLKEIFDRVREHPEQMSQMQKFMDYYLPTTIKLVQAYSEFNSISVPGENILTAKAEIEKTLDTINKAFAELLNNLFRDTVFDVTTDAQVLQSMLAREGLTKDMEFAGRSL